MNNNQQGVVRERLRNLGRWMTHYICPCLRYKQQEKPQMKRNDPSVSHTEESQSAIPHDPTHLRSQPSHLSSLNNDISLPLKQEQPLHYFLKEQGKQSPIEIKWKESNQNSLDHNQIEQMQRDYEAYIQKRQKPRMEPVVNKYAQHKFTVVGSQAGRLLCKVRTVQIQPSKQSLICHQNSKHTLKHQTVTSDAALEKYWDKRYLLFQKFDQGIKLDKESWYSVTPQAVAQYIATKIMNFPCVLDAFSGAGGDSIQLALSNQLVYSNDIDPQKLQLLTNNAAVYAVDNIVPFNSDFLKLDLPNIQIDAIYMSPPWGGPEYFQHATITPALMQPPLDLVIQKALSLTENVVMLLPHNMQIEALVETISAAAQKQGIFSTCTVSIQKIYFQGRLKFLLVLFGSKVNGVNLSDQLDYIYKMLGEGQGAFKHKRVIKKLREELGLPKVLNIVFDCQTICNKNNITLFQKFEEYILLHQLITKEKLQKLNEMDQSDSQYRNKQAAKLQKTKLKGSKNVIFEQRNKQIQTTAIKQKGQGNHLNSHLFSSGLQQTVSYVSSMSQSKIRGTILNHSPLKQELAHQFNNQVTIEKCEEV